MEKRDLSILLKSKIDLDRSKENNEQLTDIIRKISQHNFKPVISEELNETLKKIQETMQNANDAQVSQKPFISSKIGIKELLRISTYLAFTFISASYLKSISEAIDSISEADKRILKFSRILIEYGWAPTRHIDYKTMLEVVGIYNNDSIEGQEKERLVNKTLLNYYDEKRLNDLLKNWGNNLLLSKRIEILRDAVSAHVLGKYNLSIPVMLAQLEGTIASGFYHKGEIREPRYKCYLDEMISMDWNIVYDNVAVDFFVKVLMVNFQHGTKINSPSSRHAILHGADINYGSQENSLKNILFFDYIQDKFNLFSYKNSKIFHKVGCDKVKPIDRRDEKNINSSQVSNYFIVEDKKGTAHCFKKNMSFYKDIKEAQDKGLKPCKVCFKEFENI